MSASEKKWRFAVALETQRVGRGVVPTGRRLSPALRSEDGTLIFRSTSALRATRVRAILGQEGENRRLPPFRHRSHTSADSERHYLGTLHT